MAAELLDQHRVGDGTRVRPLGILRPLRATHHVRHPVQESRRAGELDVAIGAGIDAAQAHRAAGVPQRFAARELVGDS